MEHRTNIYFPKWAVVLYSLLGIGLLPWIFNLAASLPQRHIVHHWDAMWVGFDCIMLVVLALTLWLAFKKRIWVIVSGTMLATLFIVDAWFDILTARPGSEQKTAIVFGVLELLLAATTLSVVYRIIIKSTPNYQKDINLKAK